MHSKDRVEQATIYPLLVSKLQPDNAFQRQAGKPIKDMENFSFEECRIERERCLQYGSPMT